MKDTKESEKLFENIEDMLDHDIEQLTNHEEGADEELDAPEFDMEGVFNNIMRVITQKKHHSIANVLKWTSAAIIVFMLGFSSYYLMFDSNVKRHEIYASKGEKLLVVLPDGTKVFLNSDSKLSYPDRFYGRLREVGLEGEGYFQVTKDTRHPFIVRTYDMMVKVTGTKFNIKAYPENKDVVTTLDEGHVLVGKSGKEHTLRSMKPNQQAIYARRTASCSIRNVSSNNGSSDWKNNRLSFFNTPMDEVLLTLERNFNVTFIIKKNAAKKYSYTFNCSSNDIKEVIETMETITPIRIKKQDEQTYIIN